MSSHSASIETRFRVGVFTLLGIALIGAVTVFVNDRPFWWRPCQLVQISVEDATGLKLKSPIRSLGLEIGYLQAVELSETHVKLGICITAPVEILAQTTAYIRADGILGDKFVELRPVKYTGAKRVEGNLKENDKPEKPEKAGEPKSSPIRDHLKDRSGERSKQLKGIVLEKLSNEDPKSGKGEQSVNRPVQIRSRLDRLFSKQVLLGSLVVSMLSHSSFAAREIPVGQRDKDMDHVVNQVDSLVEEMHTLTGNLKEAIDPVELKQTMTKLNQTLENASKTLSPEGGLNTTAQRTLAKLEDGIEQLRDMLTRVNRGEGSLGMLLNDPKYANQVSEAAESLNKLLGKVKKVQFIIDFGSEYHPAHTSGRGWLRLGVWPEHNRYYLLGISFDPRGLNNQTQTTKQTTTTAADGTVSTVTKVINETKVEQSVAVLTFMLGKVLWDRLDVSAGALHGDGCVSAAMGFGPDHREWLYQFRTDIYAPGIGNPINARLNFQTQPWIGKPSLLAAAYVKAGFESLRQVNGKTAWTVGAGLTFDDEDIRLLFTLR